LKSIVTRWRREFGTLEELARMSEEDPALLERSIREMLTGWHVILCRTILRYFKMVREGKPWYDLIDRFAREILEVFGTTRGDVPIHVWEAILNLAAMIFDIVYEECKRIFLFELSSHLALEEE